MQEPGNVLDRSREKGEPASRLVRCSMLTCCCPWQEVKKAILRDMTRLGKEAGLKSFEQVKVPSDLIMQLFHLQSASQCLSSLSPPAGEGYLRPPGAVLHRERPADAHPEGQEKPAAGSVPVADAAALRQYGSTLNNVVVFDVLH